MRILHLIYSLNVGGAERMVITLANYQVQSNQVGLCIINNLYSQKLLNELDSRIQVFRINRKKASRNILDVFQLNRYVFKFRPDILHIHDSDAILYIPIRSFYHTILTIHAMNLPLKGYKLYNQTVAISKAVADNTENRGLCRPEVIYNGISTSAIQRTKKNIPNAEQNFRIVQVGRLEHGIKGQDLILKALHRLSSSHISIDFIGDGSSYNYLKEVTRQLKLAKQVNFLGNCDIEWIYHHLCDYHLLVQPSISEGFGLTIAEGMAAGVPVLVSDLPAPLEIIDKGKQGYYFRHNDVDDLCRMLRYIIKHYEEALQLSDKAQTFVTVNFDSKLIAQQYINLYNEYIYKTHTK